MVLTPVPVQSLHTLNTCLPGSTCSRQFGKVGQVTHCSCIPGNTKVLTCRRLLCAPNQLVIIHLHQCCRSMMNQGERLIGSDWLGKPTSFLRSHRPNHFYLISISHHLHACYSSILATNGQAGHLNPTSILEVWARLYFNLTWSVWPIPFTRAISIFVWTS